MPKRPHAPARRQSTHAAGFTLVELLAALLVFGVIFGIVAAVLPAGTRATLRNIKADAAQVSATQVDTGLAYDFTHQGSFAGFLSGNASSFNAVFQRSAPYSVSAMSDFANQTSVEVPGLSANVGEYLLLKVGDQAKLLRVTAVSGSTFTHDGCVNGLGAAGAEVFRANVMQIMASGSDVMRGLNGSPLVKAGEGVNLSFQYLYRGPDGKLITNPPGTPANVSASGDQLAYLRTSALKDRAGEASALPVNPSRVKTFLDCNASLIGGGIDDQLKVTVQGLPAGVLADVTTSGPGLNAHATSTTIYPTDLGTYTVAAGPVTASGVTYTPIVLGAPIRMTGRAQRAFVAVKYTAPPAANRGNLDIVVTGLNGKSAPATLTGAGSFTVSLTDGTLTLTNLPPGSYTLTPASAGTSVPQQPTYAATVTSGATSSVTVVYNSPASPPQAGTGRLRIDVTGLSGRSAQGDLSGPYSAALTLADGGIVVDNLPAGDYAFAAQASGASTPETGTYNIHIDAGQLSSLSVKYATPPVQPVGNIIVRVTGLPRSLPGAVVGVQGPATVQMNNGATNDDARGDDLPIGRYTIVAPPMSYQEGNDENNKTHTVTLMAAKNGGTFALQDGQTVLVTIDYGYPGQPTAGPPGGTPGGPGGTPTQTCPPGMYSQLCAANGYLTTGGGYYPEAPPGTPMTANDGSVIYASANGGYVDANGNTVLGTGYSSTSPTTTVSQPATPVPTPPSDPSGGGSGTGSPSSGTPAPPPPATPRPPPPGQPTITP